MLNRFPQTWHHWTTHDILNTFTNPHCNNVPPLIPIRFSLLLTLLTTMQCDHYGYIFLWCCVPTMKLCQRCISLPKYRFVTLKDALAQYGYKKYEVTSLPTLRSITLLDPYWRQVTLATFNQTHWSWWGICWCRRRKGRGRKKYKYWMSIHLLWDTGTRGTGG